MCSVLLSFLGLGRQGDQFDSDGDRIPTDDDDDDGALGEDDEEEEDSV